MIECRSLPSSFVCHCVTVCAPVCDGQSSMGLFAGMG